MSDNARPTRLKHGYVNSVKDWRYSSFHRFVGKAHYPNKWGTGFIIDDRNKYGE